MADMLVVNGVVVTMNPQRAVIYDGAVAIEQDRIVAVGPTAEVLAHHAAPVTIDGARKVVMPGLIDSHAHAGHGLIKTMGGARSDLWYEACETVYTVGSTEEFWHAEAQLAALERLRFGVTCGVSLLGGGDSIMRTDEPEYAAAHFGGVEQIGTRSVVAIGPTRPPFPRRYARWHGATEHTDLMVTFEQQMATCRAVIDRWHGTSGARLNVAMLTPTLREEHVQQMGQTERDEVVAQALEARALSRDSGTVFTQDGHTRGSVSFAHQIGLLGPDALLSHSTNLTAEEIAICQDTDTRIVHNPSAVASILGRCPVPELLDAGVTVCLGSDGTAPDRSGDMFRHMQQCMHYHRTYFKDPDYMPPGKVLEMVTIDAARALGMEQDIGSLETGKKADVVLVDMARPHLYPFNMPLYHLVNFANGNDVDTVVVDGKLLMQGRVVRSVDEQTVLDAAQVETEAMLRRTDLHHLLETPEGFWGLSRYPRGSTGE